ncbi:MAG: VCBS repeat-containing protein [Sandaracinaceae bacterium]|nr:MAG: VCBS repeat-containing protein [Sandaracinaceae bacterium]
MARLLSSSLLCLAACLAGCDDGVVTPTSDSGPPTLRDAALPPPPPAACESSGGAATAQAPALVATLFDRWHEAWLGSPAVADLDGDGEAEILAARHGLLLGWHLDGEVVFRAEVEGRIWASPVVADVVPEAPGLEVAVAARGQIHLFGPDGAERPGFPVAWQDELRSLAGGDIDGDGRLELVAVTTNPLSGAGQRDIVIAVNDDGSLVAGFPPNTTGAAGCDDACYVTGGYDQNVALGDVNGDGAMDVFATQDNAYLSLHDGTGRAFDAASMFEGRTKFSGVRFLHDYDEARQGWAPEEASANQAHFTNSAPAIADVDGDGANDLIVLGSVQNASQDDRLRGVALWVLHPDGSRLDAWSTPFHAPDYLAGLWDYEGTNVVGATNQVAVVDLDPERAGPEMVFAGFDGRIHAVDARAEPLWEATYTTLDRVLTAGVAVADLSGDGVPEIVFATYSPDADQSALFVLGANGAEQHRVALPGRGAMPVPTIADVDGDGALEIVVSLKDGDDRERQVLVYTVPGSTDACVLWATGRGNDLRNGFVSF